MKAEPLLTAEPSARIAVGASRLRCRHPPRVVVCVLCGIMTAALASCGLPRVAGAPDGANLRIGVGLTSGSGRDRPQSLAVLADRMIAEPLVRLGWDGRPAPNLADVQWEDGNRTLRVSLRRGVTFHNGHPLTAQVATSILNKALANSKAPDYFGGLQFVERIEATDDFTVLLHLSRPDSFLLSELDNTNIVDEQNADIGTGPFRLASRDPLRVEKYAGYYRGEPGLRSVEILPYDTRRGAWAAMMRGQLDMLQEVGRESVEFLSGSSEVRTHSSLRSFYIPLVFNVRHSVLGRVEVRRALNEAIDRQEIVTGALRDHGQVADDPIWPFHWAHNRAAKRFTHNPAAARARLDAAGLPVRNSSPDHMPSRFRFTCLFWGEEPQYERIALLLQRQLADVGVDMELEPLAQRALVNRVGTGDFDAYLFQTNGGRSLDVTYSFWHSGLGQAAVQSSGYSAADAMLERIREAVSEADMRRAVADLQQRFFEDPPAVFLAWQETTRAVSARFDIVDPNDPDIFANVWRWKPSQATRAAR